MPRVIYSVGRAPEWLDVAENLRARLGWEPVYWLTTRFNDEQVAARFPEAERHLVTDLNRCTAGGINTADVIGAVDSPGVREFADIENTVMDLLGRSELGSSYSYQDRYLHYLWFLGFWLDKLHALQPDVLVLNVSPHSPGEYVLYEVCRRHGVRVRVFLPTPVCNLHMVSDRYDALPQSLIASYARRLETQPEVNCEIREAVDQFANTEVKPWYVSETTSREERRGERKNRLRKALARNEIDLLSPVLTERSEGPLKLSQVQDGDNVEIRRVFKRPHDALSAPLLTKREFRIYLRWAYAKKTALQDFYCERAVEVSLDRPYVLFALHQQPERTTCPDGGRYCNQLLAAALLASSLPEGWSLYIKEHQAQFFYNNNGEQGRTFEFYRYLDSLPNTHLVRLEQPTTDLVASARAVATITGVIGWEALLRGIPAIVFGAAWYRACRGVHAVYDKADMKRAISAIAGGEKPKYSDALQYAAALGDIGYVCYTNTSLASAVETDISEQVRVLTSALCDAGADANLSNAS